MGSWYIKQYFLIGSYNETKFSKIMVITCKTSFCLIGPFRPHYSICLKGTAIQVV